MAPNTEMNQERPVEMMQDRPAEMNQDGPKNEENKSFLISESNDAEDDERRFIWHQNAARKQFVDDLKAQQAADALRAAEPSLPHFEEKDFKDQVRAGGGSKGKTGSTDHTRGKSAFVRPCTVGWKSQNQPPARGGGKRTPRQKG